jgi:hypothetical protein
LARLTPETRLRSPRTYGAIGYARICNISDGVFGNKKNLLF